MAEAAILNYDDLDNVAKLQKSQRFHDIMKVNVWNYVFFLFYVVSFHTLLLGYIFPEHIIC